MIYKKGLKFYKDGVLYATLNKDRVSGDFIEIDDFDFEGPTPARGEEIPEFMRKGMGIE